MNNGAYTIVSDVSTIVSGLNTIVYESNTTVYESNTTVYESNTTVYGVSTIVYGSNTTVYGVNTIVYGANTTVYAVNTIVYGANTTVYGAYTIVYGWILFNTGPVSKVFLPEETNYREETSGALLSRDGWCLFPVSNQLQNTFPAQTAVESSRNIILHRLGDIQIGAFTV